MVDFDKADEVVGFATVILSHANDEDLFVPAELVDESVGASPVIGVAGRWLDEVGRRIPSMTAGDALTVMASFDAIHRLVFHAPADREFVSRYVLNAFDSFMAGDRSVDEYRLYRAVNAEIEQCNMRFSGEPLDWTCRALESWWRNFRNGTAEELPDYDRIQQAALLLSEDLWAFEPDPQTFKKQLMGSLSLVLAKADKQHLSTCQNINNCFFKTLMGASFYDNTGLMHRL